MRDSDFSSIDDYMSEPTAEDYNDSTTSTSASFGMGSEDDFATGNANDFTIGRDPSNITNFIGPLSGNNNVPNVFDLGGGVGDFGFGNTRSQNFLNPQLAEMYKQQEIARTGVNLDKNPFVDSIFTKMFGDSIDRRRDLGSQRIQEINDLRARQAFGLPSLNTGLSYTSKDFEEGRDTNQGMVRELPMGGIERFARTFTPYGAGDFLTDIANSAERVFSGIFSGKPVAEPFDEVNPNYSAPRVNDFNQFTPSSSRTYEATDRDFTPITNVNISKENVMNPYEENLGMTIDQTGPKNYKFQDFDVDPSFNTQMNKLNSDERDFLTGRTDTISADNEDELMADASSYVPQSFIDAGEGLGQLFNEDGVPIGPGNLRFQYDPDQEESQFKYTIPFTA